MITIRDHRKMRVCQGFTRREFLRIGGLGLGGFNNPPMPVGMPLLGPQVDHAVAAFLVDLEARGPSEKILLVVTGEMGRSPKNGGTGHWSRLTPLLVAGGCLRMGQVVGQTDRSGGEATSRHADWPAATSSGAIPRGWS